MWGFPIPNLPWAAPDMSLRPYIAPYSRKQPDRTVAYVPWPNVYQGNPELALVYLYGILLNRMHAPSFDAACQLALMMGLHPRLGAASPLRDLDDNILQYLAMQALAYRYDVRIMLALDETPSGLGIRRTSRLLQALFGREELFQGDSWIRSFAFTTLELWIFFLMGQRYYKFPLPTQQVGDGAPPRAPLPKFWNIPKPLQLQAYANLSEVFGLRQQNTLVSVRHTAITIPRHMHLIELRENGVIALTTLILHLTFCPTATIAALWQQARQAWDSTADLLEPPPPSKEMQLGSCNPLVWTESKILEMVVTWLAHPKPYSAPPDTNRQSFTGLDAWVLDTLALFLGPAALQDLVPGLRYLHTVRLHRGHPHIGSLAVAPHLDANGQPPDNWMLVAWIHATESHFTPPVLPKDPRNFMFVTAFEQQRAATAEWGFHTLWQTVQRLTSDWRRAFWVTGRLRTLALMMGGHLRLGQKSPLQTLDSHILARFASDAFFFNIADLDGEDRHQGLLFSLRLPMDPSTHWVVGQAEDTVGDVINRFKSGSWTEADLLITVNDTPLSWTERVHERVFPGALVIVSLNIRANATTYKAPMGRDQTPSDSGPILTHLKGPTMEVSYSAANGRNSTRSLVVPQSATPRDICLLMSGCDPLLSQDAYLLLDGKTLTDFALTQPLATTSTTRCRLQLMCRLRGGMQSGQPDAQMSEEPEGTLDQNLSPSHVDWLCLMKKFTDAMGVPVDKLEEDLDPGMYEFVSPQQCREILRGSEGDTLIPPLPEVISRLQADFHEAWTLIFSTHCPPDAMASACSQAASFITDHLTTALQAPELRGNRIHRLLHTGQGKPVQVDPSADREALIIISGFRNERSLTTELASIGFEPPLQGHKGAFKCDVFIPHSDSPGDPTASGLCHLVVRRTPRAIDLLEGFMSGKSTFAPDIVPKNSSLIMVNRNVVYHEDNGAAGSTTTRPRKLAAPLMILEPLNDIEALKYQLVVRLLTSLGLSSDGLSTLLVTAIRKLGQTNLGAAEIYPSHGKSFSDVFTRKQKGGRGHLIVTYSTFIRPAGTRTLVAMDLSSCILHYCASQDKGGNVTTLPTLLSQLAFTLILQKKDVCTERERDSTAAVVLHMTLTHPMDFFVTHHNRHCVNGEQDVLIRGSPSRAVIEDWLRNHVISFMQRLVPLAVTHLLNADTVAVEITAGRQGSIGPGSQLLILFRAPEGRSPLTSQAATTLALQLGLLVASRGEEGSCLGLQWCPLMSLIPGYPQLGGREARCELDRVTWRIPELDSGVTPDPSSSRPRYRLARGQGTVTISEAQNDAFLLQLCRLFRQTPEKLSPNVIVAFAAAQAFTQAHTRQRAESRAILADAETRQQDTPLVLATPEAILAAQAPRLRNLAGLRSLAEMEEYMRRAQARIATGSVLRCHGTHEWITMSPSAWFNALYLRKHCPLIEMLLKPDTRTIPKLASLQVPFCLQCRVCFGEGVYNAELIAYCLDCLPMILGYAAASRFIHCVLDLHQSLVGTHQALRVKPPLSSRGLKICDQILAMAPHALPYLVTSAIRPPGSHDLAARHKDFIREDIQVFLGICEVLSNYISQSNPPCQQEAALREEYLLHSLRLDVELLMTHLISFSREAITLSHANTLHACPAHLQSEMQIDNWQADSVTKTSDSVQSVHVSSSSNIRMTTPPRDMSMGVRDTRSDDCLPFVGSSHPQPSERSMLPQSSAMPPGTPTTLSAPQASTAIP
jgi:hypothetical protein